MSMLIVEARFYDAIADRLLEGARGVLDEAGIEYDVVTVPGALEIPAAIAMAMEAAPYAGAVALGCVIEGQTYHLVATMNDADIHAAWQVISEHIGASTGAPFTIETTQGIGGGSISAY
ncbi:MAG: 6,7-dimethyl-8-ribityllumazine synthase [Pseudolabrys sp.]